VAGEKLRALKLVGHKKKQFLLFMEQPLKKSNEAAHAALLHPKSLNASSVCPHSL